MIEDQLHEKVTEVSGLEAELLGARNQLQKATQGEEDKIPAEKVRDLRRDFAALERNNDALRAQVSADHMFNVTCSKSHTFFSSVRTTIARSFT